MKKVEIQARRFRTRFFWRLVNGLWFFIFLFGYGYIITSSFFFLFLTLFIAGLKVWISFKESKNYIQTIQFVNGRIFIYYFVRDLELPVVELELQSAEIEYFGNGIGFSSISSPRLVFRKSGKVILVQYLVGNWNKSLMEEVVIDFKEFTKSFPST